MACYRVKPVADPVLDPDANRLRDLVMLRDRLAGEIAALRSVEFVV